MSDKKKGWLTRQWEETKKDPVGKVWKNKWTIGGTAAAWMCGIPVLPLPGLMETAIGGAIGFVTDKTKGAKTEEEKPNKYMPKKNYKDGGFK